MLDIFSRFFDTLFPPHVSVLTVQNLSREPFLKLATQSLIGKTQTLSSYHHPHIKAAITANKFHDNHKAANLLAALFDEWYAEQHDVPTLFVPIPLSSKRQKERGYNQVERILQASTYAQTHIHQLLVRKTHRVAQTSLPRIERLQNVRGVFAYKPTSDLCRYRRIIILDDVTTTGATMEEALQVLRKELGKTHKIMGVTIAH